jgi:hypothetical protein
MSIVGNDTLPLTTCLIKEDKKIKLNTNINIKNYSHNNNQYKYL